MSVTWIDMDDDALERTTPSKARPTTEPSKGDRGGGP
ncbi:hypothetical protein B046DRAFT_02580 [Streptomyces sp. LamerLS-316]|nr:hypothetical protein B046DRAFT_02580 [Streptomyces sp. LamerLS-316]